MLEQKDFKAVHIYTTTHEPFGRAKAQLLLNHYIIKVVGMHDLLDVKILKHLEKILLICQCGHCSHSIKYNNVHIHIILYFCYFVAFIFN